MQNAANVVLLRRNITMKAQLDFWSKVCKHFSIDVIKISNNT